MRAGEHPPAGARVADRYTIVEPISAGAMGAVYRARDEAGAEVALKRLTDATQAARFEIEGRLLARLDHPRVVRVHGPVIDRNDRWLAMDLVAGRDLARVARERGALPEQEVIAHAREACQALDYIHAQQIVHRDVKPSNLILSPDGIVLVDFGIAREYDPSHPGTRIGTPLYVAPEVAAGHPASPRSDVYGLAATMLALLTARPPEPARAPGFLRDALALDPADRPPSAAAFAAALGATISAAGDDLSVGDALLSAVVRATAAAFDAAAVSLATGDPLTYRVAWGAGADAIVGVSLPAGTGIGAAVHAGGVAEAIGDCRADPRFAAAVARATGYVPHTMIVAPVPGGILSILDRRDGLPFTASDLPRAALFADLVAVASGHVPQHPSAP